MITLYVNYTPLGMLVELAEKSYSGAAFISCSDADRKLRSQEMNVKRVKVKLHFTQKCSGFFIPESFISFDLCHFEGRPRVIIFH